MKSNKAESIGWIVAFALVVFVPAGLMLLGEVPEGRGFWVDFGAFIGFMAFAVFCTQFLTTGRFPRVAKPLGVDTLLNYHRQVGLVATVLVLVHVGAVIAADPSYISFFDPRVNAPRAISLAAVLLALGALGATSIWRMKLGLTYEVWRLVHTGLAALVLAIALAHLIKVGHFTSSHAKTGVWVLLAIAAFCWLGHVRIFKPLLALRKPWRVVEIRSEATDIHTVALEAVEHAGFRFEAGQYAWITIGETPFRLQQHPFTLASSPSSPDRVEFTFKALGDFTSSLHQLPTGSRAYLEGPYGHFTLRTESFPATVFLAGGIGITPCISMLRWLRATRSRHRFYLFYAAETLGDLAFREELKELCNCLDLRLFCILESPPPDWEGEEGLLTTEVIRKHLPEDEFRQYDYLVCGPPPMAAAVHEALRSLQIPLKQQRDERFDII